MLNIEAIIDKALPSLIGTLAGGVITFIIFYLNKRFENRRKEEEEAKEQRELYRKLYGELFRLGTLYIYSITRMNFHNIQRSYYNHAATRTVDTAFLAECRQRALKEHDDYILEATKVSEVSGKFEAILAEYYYINSKSEVINMYSKIRLINPNYTKDDFKSTMSDEVLSSYRQVLIDKMQEFTNTNFRSILTEIIETMRTESLKVE